MLDDLTVGSRSGMVEKGERRPPSQDSRIPFVDTRDIAAVAALSQKGSRPDLRPHVRADFVRTAEPLVPGKVRAR